MRIIKEFKLEDFLLFNLNMYDTIYKLYDYDTDEVIFYDYFSNLPSSFNHYKIQYYEIDFKEEILKITVKNG